MGKQQFLAFLLSAPLCWAQVQVFDSPNFSSNADTRQEWLDAMLIQDTEAKLNFETGFNNGDNIHSVSLLGGLIIKSEDESVIITDDSSLLGGSIPIDTFAASLNEEQEITLDFDQSPVNYISLHEIDNLQVSYTISLEDGSSFIHQGDPTGSSSKSAEFVAFYSPLSRITLISMSSTNGDGKWGLDDLEYGTIQTLYVDQSATGAGTGSSWANAFPTLQAALTSSTNPDQILVAEGTYRPDEGPGQVNDSEDSSFIILKDKTAIYGGFPSGGSLATQRNHKTYPTILSGRLNPEQEPPIQADNVIYQPGNSQRGYLLLNGIIIEQGNANGPFPKTSGSGLHTRATSTTPPYDLFLKECVFRENGAITSGGAVRLGHGGFTEIESCLFDSNTGGAGGAINSANSASASVIIQNCFFKGNRAQNGGVFLTNSRDYYFTNCQFSGNQATLVGSVAVTNQGDTSYTNCTFQGNSGDSLFWFSNTFAALLTTEFTARNCIIWNNAVTATETFVIDPSLPTSREVTVNFMIDSSLIEGFTPSNFTGSGNLDGTDPNNSPLFVDPVNPSDAPTNSGDLRLITDSPAIDAGNNGFVSSVFDLNGRARIIDGDENGTATVDLGAFEALSSPEPLRVLNIRRVEDSSQEGEVFINFLVSGEPGFTFVLQESPIPTTSTGFQFSDTSHSFTLFETPVPGTTFSSLSFAIPADKAQTKAFYRFRYTTSN